MANARCREHSIDLVTGAKVRYVARVEPLNYPNTAAMWQKKLSKGSLDTSKRRRMAGLSARAT